MNYVEHWTKAHAERDGRWLAFSKPEVVISRFGIDLKPIRSVLEVGPGVMLLADHLESLGKRVLVHDLIHLDDRRFVAELPLKEPVDLAIAHLVLQHVPACDHHDLVSKVIASLAPGASFYFDAVSDDTSCNKNLAEEFMDGTSCPFTAWDLVTSSKRVMPGYYFCVAKNQGLE